MDTTILLGLSAAGLFSLANFIARFSSRSSGVVPTLFWGQVFLSLVSLCTMVTVGELPIGTLTQWLMLVVSSAAIISGTGCLYRGLEMGRLSVVAPIMASYGAVTAALSLIAGAPMTMITGVGLTITVAGAIMSAIPSSDASKSKPSGWLPAMASAVLFGVGYWLQGKYVIPIFGPVPTIATYYLIATVVLGAFAMLTHQNLFCLDSPKEAAMVILTAALGGGGFAALALSQSTGDIAVATALSSAATAVTVILACMFLREKPGWNGWVGVICVAGGVATLQMAAV